MSGLVGYKRKLIAAKESGVGIPRSAVESAPARRHKKLIGKIPGSKPENPW